MQSAILFDRTRINWTRQDWERYKAEDQQYGEELIDTLYNGNFNEITKLIDKGVGYYHFPNDTYALISLQERKPQVFYFLMSKKDQFYKFSA